MDKKLKDLLDLEVLVGNVSSSDSGSYDGFNSYGRGPALTGRVICRMKINWKTGEVKNYYKTGSRRNQ